MIELDILVHQVRLPAQANHPPLDWLARLGHPHRKHDVPALDLLRRDAGVEPADGASPTVLESSGVLSCCRLNHRLQSAWGHGALLRGCASKLNLDAHAGLASVLNAHTNLDASKEGEGEGGDGDEEVQERHPNPDTGRREETEEEKEEETATTKYMKPGDAPADGSTDTPRLCCNRSV